MTGRKDTSCPPRGLPAQLEDRTHPVHVYTSHTCILYTLHTYAYHTQHTHTRTHTVHHVCAHAISTKHVHTGAPHTYTIQHTHFLHIPHTGTHVTHIPSKHRPQAHITLHIYTYYMHQTYVHTPHYTYHTHATHSTIHIPTHITCMCTYKPGTVCMHIYHTHSTHLYTCTVHTLVVYIRVVCMDTALLECSSRILRPAAIGWCDM